MASDTESEHVAKIAMVLDSEIESSNLTWPDPFSAGCLSIRDYKHLLLEWVYL